MSKQPRGHRAHVTVGGELEKEYQIITQNAKCKKKRNYAKRDHAIMTMNSTLYWR